MAPETEARLAGTRDPAGPDHLAVILVGNRRWAKNRHLSALEGHAAGADNVVRFLSLIRDYPFHYVTLYAFSTENWTRSAAEVAGLMDLLSSFLDAKLPELLANRIRLRVTGRPDRLPSACRDRLERVCAATAAAGSYDRTLILALDYGGRAELADAAAKIAAEVKAGLLTPEQVDEACVARHLYLPDVPDPDLMIRTGGDVRISNFLLWELSYAEFYFTPVLWPDFGREELDRALESFRSRNRRFGGNDRQ